MPVVFRKSIEVVTNAICELEPDFVLNIGQAGGVSDISVERVMDRLKIIWSSIESWLSDTISWLKDKLTFWNNSKDKMSSGSEDEDVLSYCVGTLFVPRDD